jgi:hypothetical protein
MHTRTLLRIFCLLIVVGLPFSNVQGSTDGWGTIVPGIDYQVFPNEVAPGYNVYVTRMDRSNSNLIIESGLTSGGINRSWGTVRDMANYYNGAINSWGKAWGSTNQVVVAINGDFYDKDVTNVLPAKGMVHSGWYDRTYPDNNGWSGFTWKRDRSAFIGECVINAVLQMTYGNGAGSLPIKGINWPTSDGQLTVYTPEYGNTTPPNSSGWVQVVVQMSNPTLILNRSLAVNGTIISIQNGGAVPIPFDSIVLAGTGTTAADLLAHSHAGETIGITQEVTSLDAGSCKTNLGSAKDWTNAYASIGGSYAVVQNGTVYGYTENDGAREHRARTTIAMNDQYIYFIVNEGLYRTASKGGFIGFTYEEVGKFATEHLGATWAIVEDGGGSSTMVINGQIVNHMADCADKNYNLVPNDTWCERTMVNGLMMVVNQPKHQSTIHADGSQVTTRGSTSLRLGPGTNYGSLAEIPDQAQLTVIPESHGLNGVVAKGSPWWKVTTGSQEGWVSMLALNGPRLNLPVILQR